MITFLAVLQMLLSLLFYKFGNLFFFLDEQSEVVPVKNLLSQGGGEDLLISVGAFLFFILSVFNFFRFQHKIKLIDCFVLFIILFMQAFSLLMVEVASFSLSFVEMNGWILLLWFFVYACLWLVLFAITVNLI